MRLRHSKRLRVGRTALVAGGAPSNGTISSLSLIPNGTTGLTLTATTTGPCSIPWVAVLHPSAAPFGSGATATGPDAPSTAQIDAGQDSASAAAAASGTLVVTGTSGSVNISALTQDEVYSWFGYSDTDSTVVGGLSGKTTITALCIPYGGWAAGDDQSSTKEANYTFVFAQGQSGMWTDTARTTAVSSDGDLVRSIETVRANEAGGSVTVRLEAAADADALVYKNDGTTEWLEHQAGNGFNYETDVTLNWGSTSIAATRFGTVYGVLRDCDAAGHGGPVFSETIFGTGTTGNRWWIKLLDNSNSGLYGSFAARTQPGGSSAAQTFINGDPTENTGLQDRAAHIVQYNSSAATHSAQLWLNGVSKTVVATDPTGGPTTKHASLKYRWQSGATEATPVSKYYCLSVFGGEADRTAAEIKALGAMAMGIAGVGGLTGPFDSAPLVAGADYYVSATGNDWNSGLVASAPRLTTPTTLPASATINFAAGSYDYDPGFGMPGTSGAPITYAGPATGAPAVMDGGEEITGWSLYGTAAGIGGNGGVGGFRVWKAAVPAGFDPADALWQHDGTAPTGGTAESARLLHLCNNGSAVSNASPEEMLNDNTTYATADGAGTDISVTDSAVTGYTTPTAFTYLGIYLYAAANRYTASPVTGINYTTGKIDFYDVSLINSAFSYPQGTPRYALLNHPDDFWEAGANQAKEGTFYADIAGDFDATPGIYLVTRDDVDPTATGMSIVRSVRQTPMNVSANNVVVKNFRAWYGTIEATYGGKRSPYRVGSQNLSVFGANVDVRDVDCRHGGSIAVQTGASDVIIRRPRVERAYDQRAGIATKIKRLRWENPVFSFTFDSGITAFSPCQYQVLGHTGTHILGGHGNGAAIQFSSSFHATDVLFAGGSYVPSVKASIGIAPRRGTNFVLAGLEVGQQNQAVAFDPFSALYLPGTARDDIQTAFVTNISIPGTVGVLSLGSKDDDEGLDHQSRSLTVVNSIPETLQQGHITNTLPVREYNHFGPYAPFGPRPPVANYRTGEVQTSGGMNAWFVDTTSTGAGPDARLTASAPSTLDTGRSIRLPGVGTLDWIGKYRRSDNFTPDWVALPQWDEGACTLTALSVGAKAVGENSEPDYWPVTVRVGSTNDQTWVDEDGTSNVYPSGWHGEICVVVTSSATTPTPTEIFEQTATGLIMPLRFNIFGYSVAASGDDAIVFRLYDTYANGDATFHTISAGDHVHVAHAAVLSQTVASATPDPVFSEDQVSISGLGARSVTLA